MCHNKLPLINANQNLSKFQKYYFTFFIGIVQRNLYNFRLKFYWWKSVFDFCLVDEKQPLLSFNIEEQILNRKLNLLKKMACLTRFFIFFSIFLLVCSDFGFQRLLLFKMMNNMTEKGRLLILKMLFPKSLYFSYKYHNRHRRTKLIYAGSFLIKVPKHLYVFPCWNSI